MHYKISYNLKSEKWGKCVYNSHNFGVNYINPNLKA